MYRHTLATLPCPPTTEPTCLCKSDAIRVAAKGYRYGFNGKENDTEWGDQLIQDYGFRLYNPALGKFLSVDPLTGSYPMLTPYQFASNTPIMAIDLDGLERFYSTSGDRIAAIDGSMQIRVVDENAVKNVSQSVALANQLRRASNNPSLGKDEAEATLEAYNNAVDYSLNASVSLEEYAEKVPDIFEGRGLTSYNTTGDCMAACKADFARGTESATFEMTTPFVYTFTDNSVQQGHNGGILASGDPIKGAIMLITQLKSGLPTITGVSLSNNGNIMGNSTNPNRATGHYTIVSGIDIQPSGNIVFTNRDNGDGQIRQNLHLNTQTGEITSQGRTGVAYNDAGNTYQYKVSEVTNTVGTAKQSEK